MFLITTKFIRELDRSVRSYKNNLEFIREELLKLEVSKLTIEENRINFSINFFSQGRNHPMGVVDKGYFEIDPYTQKVNYCTPLVSKFWKINFQTNPLAELI